MTAKQEHVVLLQVKLEFGHKASCRKRPTPEGFTHDWIVFVRGQDDKDISQFVDKVVFHLHESFQKPKRVFKDPPYVIEEHGYGSFSLPIDVYFKNKEEPKKVRIEYDLFLPALGMPAIDNIRSEALKFMNPPEEFKKKVLKAGGEIVDAINGANGSLLTSSNGTVNGNASNHGNSVNNGKEIKKEIKEEKNNAVNETEKVKKTKLDKQVPKPEKQVPKPEKQVPKPEKQVPKPEKQVKLEKQVVKPEKQVLKTANKVTNQSTGPTPCKRLSEDNEVVPKVKKKKKKGEDVITSPPNPKPTGFIPIEPLPAGVEEQHGIGDNKDIKLKIKSLPSKQSKKLDKPPEKIIDKKKEKKKDTLEAMNSTSNTSLVDKNQKKTTSSSSKTKSSKSPTEIKKIPKKEERKVEKLTFRRESGDSWSSTSSTSSPGLYSSINSKSNPLGTLMAELSDQDDDDDDEDIDISTPFQTDALTSKTGSFLALSNNNILHKKDTKLDKTKTKVTTKKDSKASSHGSKNGTVKSPTNPSKNVESSKPSNKLSSKTKGKETKNGKNISTGDLVHLHKELSSLKDSSSLQQVVDILEQSGCFIITDTNLEFDLYKLDVPTIRQIQKCIKR